MGNNTSRIETQTGGYDLHNAQNAHANIQNTVQQLLRSNNDTENMTFNKRINSTTDFDIDTHNYYKQEAGASGDKIKVKLRRQRYGNNINGVSSGTVPKIGDVSFIHPTNGREVHFTDSSIDFSRSVSMTESDRQDGGTMNLMTTESENISNLKQIKFASNMQVSESSIRSINVEKILSNMNNSGSIPNQNMYGGSNGNITNTDFKIMQNAILSNVGKCTPSNEVLAGGCGCAGADEFALSSTSYSATSGQPVDYSMIMKGGNHNEKHKKTETETETESDEEDDLESESDEDDDESDEDMDDDEESDELSRPRPSSSSSLSSTTNNSSSNSSSSMSTTSVSDSENTNTSVSRSIARTKKSRKSKRQASSESSYESSYESATESSQNGGQINARYLFSSDSNSVYASDSIANEYRTYKNRTFLD